MNYKKMKRDDHRWIMSYHGEESQIEICVEPQKIKPWHLFFLTGEEHYCSNLFYHVINIHPNILYFCCSSPCGSKSMIFFLILWFHVNFPFLFFFVSVFIWEICYRFKVWQLQWTVVVYKCIQFKYMKKYCNYITATAVVWFSHAECSCCSLQTY